MSNDSRIEGSGNAENQLFETSPAVLYQHMLSQHGMDSSEARALRQQHAHDPSFMAAAEVIEAAMRTEVRAVRMTALGTDVPIAQTSRSLPMEVGEDFML